MISLSSLHTFGLTNSCRNLTHLTDVEQVEQVLLSDPDKHFIIGGGSNCVFVEDFDGTIVKNDIRGRIASVGDSHVNLEVGAGENWHQLVVWCLDNGIYGLENLALIPGTVGAAPIQNIGAYGVEIASFIDYVAFYDFETRQLQRLRKEDCQFGYRESIFKRQLDGKMIIVEVGLCLPRVWQGVSHYGELAAMTNPSAKDIFNKVVEIRQAKLPDPEKLGNAGSFFKNPVISIGHYQELQEQWPEIPHYPVSEEQVKVPAAWLIDQLGFKGKTRNGIRCHPTQSLVLTNLGMGKGEDLLGLAREIRDSVQHSFAIELENEVRLVGKGGLISL